jgi:predicted transcriptional regulator
MLKSYLQLLNQEFGMRDANSTDGTIFTEGVDDADPHAGQVLDGAKAIQRYLVHLGFTAMTEKRVFHWAANGRLPVKKIGNRLVANKRALLRHLGLE